MRRPKSNRSVTNEKGLAVRALFIQHDHVSPTGPVSERLRYHGFDVVEELVVPEASFANPNVTFEFPNADEYDLIIPMGAPWGAWDDACIGNWLQPEIEWLRAAVTSGKPVLGICFGGQLIARAMGGSVSPAPQCEIGWKDVWSDRPEIFGNGPWFQFHYDRWQLPPKAVEIARNPIASQAFIINRSLAIQFHPEITAASLEGWLDWGGDVKVIADGQDPEIMKAQTRAYESAATQRTFELVDGFLRQVAELID
ncbi:MAG: type 1 glutamine amidotransferase [Actinomycetales bacterium]|nr:type 1 glutamine amidotransferase [Actinomycetales bacterium]